MDHSIAAFSWSGSASATPTVGCHDDTGPAPITGLSDSIGAVCQRHPLCDGSVQTALRAAAPPGLVLRSEAELEATLTEALRGHEAAEDLHVFGYGSLMWNPGLDVLDSSVARVPGWHRRFSVRLLFGRGSPEAPGAMLALDRGGACHGMLYRIAAARVRDELRLLWRREMLGGTYDARWVWAWSKGRWLRALSFVAIRCHVRYIGGLPVAAVAQLVRTGRGAFDEDPHLRTQIAIGRVDHVNRRSRGAPVRQQRYQRACLHRLLNRIGRRLDDAQARQRSGQIGVDVVDDELVAERELQLLIAVGKAEGQWTHAARDHAGGGQARDLRRRGGRAVRLQEGRRGTRGEPERTDVPRHHHLLADGAGADGAVGAFGHQIDVLGAPMLSSTSTSG
jgi:cation transport protein ChaC